jgi:hypothetical protein
MEQFDVQWIDRGREPQCPSRPEFPNGIDIVVGQPPSCTVELPYPAKRCGYYVVKCRLCGFSVICTTAGRPDDPKSLTVPCLKAAAA